jgi:short-subunit dehydrogenase
MKNLVITGATGDIARELIAQVQQLSDYNLILLSRDISSLQGLSAHLYQVDLADEVAVFETCQQISAKFGAIDILINNAGYGHFREFLADSTEAARQMFDINVFGLMTVTRAFLPDMKRQHSGQIINIASIASYLATAKATSYAASKFAVRGFSDALRQEVFADHIKVLVVNTGPVLTKFHAQNPDYLKKVGKHTLTASAVAKKILANFQTDRRELNLPWQLNLARLFALNFPRITDKITRRFFNLK